MTNTGTTCTTCNINDMGDGSVRHRFWMKTSSAQTYFADNPTNLIKEVSFSPVVVKRPSSLLAD